MADLTPVQSVSALSKAQSASTSSNQGTSSDAFESALQQAQDNLNGATTPAVEPTQAPTTPVKTGVSAALESIQSRLLNSTPNTDAATSGTAAAASQMLPSNQETLVKNASGAANSLQSQVQSLSFSSPEVEEDTTDTETETVSVEQDDFLTYLNTPAESTDLF